MTKTRATYVGFRIMNSSGHKFANLMCPIYIGNVQVPNRLALAPINTGYAVNHSVSDQLVIFHSRIAEGGVGLSIVGSTAVSTDGIVNAGSLALDQDNKISGLSRLVRSIKKQGSVCAIQLNHAGRKIDDDVKLARIVAPSSVPERPNSRIPVPLAFSEINGIVDRFGEAAMRAVQSGVDIIEIHCAHGYLIHQFLSPLSNRRTDTYGGSLLNRTRFALEVVESVRHQTDQQVPIICRISAEDLSAGGLRITETRLVAKWLVEAGVDAIDVSVGMETQQAVPNRGQGIAPFADYSLQIKATVNVPVLVAGNIPSLEIAERIIANGKADIVSMARPLVADPFLIRKSLSGNEKSVSWCTQCGQCNYRRHKRQHITCPLNDDL